ncbi:glycoside hydrolase superfamily, partial [Mycena galopus ATCC 62051]
QVLQNRAFQQVTPGTTEALNSWSLQGNTSHIAVVKSSNPVSPALPNSLALTVPAGTTETVRLVNSGYGGIFLVSGEVYTVSFFHRTLSPLFPNSSSTFTISFPLSDAPTDSSTQTSETFTFSEEWQQTNFSYQMSEPSGNTTFHLTVPPDMIAGQTMEFTMFTVFPPTFKGRTNGMRLDISNALMQMKPTFLRFPGGNNLEGDSTATRWQWKNTIGPLVNRPGRQGTWGYVNTDGLGLYEYLQWIEDMEMEPIMAVWAGYSLDGDSIPQPSLAPFIQDAIDQISFAIGDPTTNAWAAVRASMGHPAPFNLRFIEIGNEDFRAPGNTYNNYRWGSFVTALEAQFPQLTYIATSAEVLSAIPVVSPAPLAWDLHVYEATSFFRTMCFQFDIQPRNGLLFMLGEYAATTDDTGAILPYPSIDSSIAEAAYMTGLDRNSQIVFGSSYSRLLNVGSPFSRRTH